MANINWSKAIDVKPIFCMYGGKRIGIYDLFNLFLTLLQYKILRRYGGGKDNLPDFNIFLFIVLSKNMNSTYKPL